MTRPCFSFAFNTKRPKPTMTMKRPLPHSFPIPHIYFKEKIYVARARGGDTFSISEYGDVRAL